MINFENCPVTLANFPISFADGYPDDFEDLTLFASSASISDSVAIENSPRLGLQGLSGAYPTAPPEGTISVDFYVSGADDVNPFMGLKKESYEGDFISAEVGPYTAATAILTSYEITAEANDIITASVSLDYYGGLTEAPAPAQDLATGRFGHGYVSTGDFHRLGFSTLPFSFSYSFNQGFEILREVGESTLDVALWRDGNEQATLQGYDLPHAVTVANNYPNTGGFEFKIKNICDEQYAKVGLTGEIVSRDISVSEDNVVNGSLELTRALGGDGGV